MVFEFTPDLLVRLSASKVMSRAELGNLTPSKSITATTRTGNVNNPLLDPIRAKTADLALEWYFAPGSLLSVAYFYKDIETYIQRITSPVRVQHAGPAGRVAVERWRSPPRSSTSASSRIRRAVR